MFLCICPCSSLMVEILLSCLWEYSCQYFLKFPNSCFFLCGFSFICPEKGIPQISRDPCFCTSFKSEARKGWWELVIISVGLTAASFAVGWCTWIVELKTLMPDSLSLSSWVGQVSQRRLPNFQSGCRRVSCQREKNPGELGLYFASLHSIWKLHL